MSEITYFEALMQGFMEKDKRDSYLNVEPVEWGLPTGKKIIEKIVFNAQNCKSFGKLLQRNLNFIQGLFDDCSYLNRIF